jgi:hypothetical protein
VTSDSEKTPLGDQLLIAGVTPVSMRERLEHLWHMPKLATKRQKPCDDGLFDLAARNQLELF